MKTGSTALIVGTVVVAGVATTTTSTTTTSTTSTTLTTEAIRTQSPKTPPPPPPPPTVTVPAGYTVVPARNFGVVCDGVVDDTARIQTALRSLRPYQALELPAGTCRYSNVMSLYAKSNVMVFGGGRDQTVLKAMDPLRSSFVVSQSSNVILQGFEIYSPNSTVRRSDAISRGIYVEKSNGVIVDSVRVRKVAGAGILYWVSKDGKITNSEVVGSLADAFHITGASSNITLQFNRATGAGDDCFASIGYGTAINTNIQFLDGYCANNKASGISFEGTTGGFAARNTLVRTGVAGIRVASVASYRTGPVYNILLQDNVLEEVRTRQDVGHAAIMLFVGTTGAHVRNVKLDRTTIKNPLTSTGFRAYGKSQVEDVQASLTNTQMVTDSGRIGNPIAIGAYATVNRSGNTCNGGAC